MRYVRFLLIRMMFPLFALAVFAGCEAEEETEVESARDVVAAFLEAQNAHDISRQLGLLHDNVAYYVEEDHRLKGRSEIKALAEWDSVLLTEKEFGDYEELGDSLLVDQFTETNQWVQRMELERLTHLPGTLFRVDDGLIIEIRPAGLSEDSRLDVQAALEGFLQWAEPRFPEEVGELFDEDGRMAYSAENAQRWMRLLLQWHESEDPLEQTGIDRAP